MEKSTLINSDVVINSGGFGGSAGGSLATFCGTGGAGQSCCVSDLINDSICIAVGGEGGQ